MVGHGIRLVGIDSPSIEEAIGEAIEKAMGETIDEAGGDSHPVHTTLLSAGVVILEGLDLSNVPAGGWELVCLPLNIAGADGAPGACGARAALTDAAAVPPWRAGGVVVRPSGNRTTRVRHTGAHARGGRVGTWRC